MVAGGCCVIISFQALMLGLFVRGWALVEMMLVPCHYPLSGMPVLCSLYCIALLVILI